MSNELRIKILVEGAKGSLPYDEAQAMLNVLNGAPIFKPTSSNSINGEIYQTLDTHGDLLVPGKNYMFDGEKVKVLNEQHGSGNMLDAYMRVFYIDSTLEQKFTIVEGKYPQGVFNGAVYKSKFEPIKNI
jgi:hypothetical protein